MQGGMAKVTTQPTLWSSVTSREPFGMALGVEKVTTGRNGAVRSLVDCGRTLKRVAPANLPNCGNGRGRTAEAAERAEEKRQKDGSPRSWPTAAPAWSLCARRVLCSFSVVHPG